MRLRGPTPWPSARSVIKFRNYTPKSKDLEAAVLPKAPLPSASLQVVSAAAAAGGAGEGAAFVSGTGAGGPDASLGTFVGVLSGAAAVDPATIAPKKSNWDLKRDVEKRLQRLDLQTQAAIQELFRASPPPPCPPPFAPPSPPFPCADGHA